MARTSRHLAVPWLRIQHPSPSCTVLSSARAGDLGQHYLVAPKLLDPIFQAMICWYRCFPSSEISHFSSCYFYPLASPYATFWHEEFAAMLLNWQEGGCSGNSPLLPLCLHLLPEQSWADMHGNVSALLIHIFTLFTEIIWPIIWDE